MATDTGEKNVLPASFPPRPGIEDPAVGIVWSGLMMEHFPLMDGMKPFLISFYPNMSINDMLNAVFIPLTNKEVATIALAMEPYQKAAYRSVVREWVIASAIRFNGKEGDAVEMLDPETGKGKLKMGSVLAIYRDTASALIQYRDNKDNLITKEIGAETIVRFFRDGKPSDNTPRGGKVGFQMENAPLMAKAA